MRHVSQHSEVIKRHGDRLVEQDIICGNLMAMHALFEVVCLVFVVF